ncbi:FtsW/RodA/SpoVE family cell cycle protein [Patescibacteria group bacterium]
MSNKKVDRIFFITIATLVLFGFFVFTSASLGLLTKGEGRFSSALFSQAVMGLLLGGIAFFTTTKVHYRKYKKFAFYIFLTSIILTLLVFVPKIGMSHGGASRWLLLGPISFQPAEFLKLGFVIYYAAWLTGIKDKVKTVKYGVLPLVIMLGLIGGILLSQPDTGTFLVILISAIGMFIVAGARWKHISILGLISALGFGVLVLLRPYIWERVLTFIDPARDSLGAGYQIQQSLIAIGSGEIFGRGFGKSIQKFNNFLPEPIGDSIFAVTAEEWGFIGSIFLISLFLILTFRGFKIASNAPDRFSSLLVVGIILLISSQSLINIGAMLGVFPLIGMPLLFVSHGGTALLFALAEVGIVLNVSRYMR